MTALLEWHDRLSQRTLAAARTGQALAIEVVDRLVSPRSDRPGVLTRVLHLEIDAMGAVVGDPTRLVDQTYDVAQRLVTLHREFANRLLEVVDAREPDLATSADQGHLASVHPMRRARARA